MCTRHKLHARSARTGAGCFENYSFKSGCCILRRCTKARGQRGGADGNRRPMINFPGDRVMIVADISSSNNSDAYLIEYRTVRVRLTPPYIAIRSQGKTMRSALVLRRCPGGQGSGGRERVQRSPRNGGPSLARSKRNGEEKGSGAYRLQLPIDNHAAAIPADLYPDPGALDCFAVRELSGSAVTLPGIPA